MSDNERTVGDVVYISRGTAMAIEKVVLDEDGTYNKYDSLWVNVKTLARNYHGSFTVKDSIPNVDGLCVGFKTEIDTIIDLFVDINMDLVLYVTEDDVKEISSLFPDAKVKTKFGVKALIADDLMVAMVDSVILTNDDIKKFGVRVKADGEKSLMLSHKPIDLLSHKRFGKLTLIESHTGKLKNKSEWISKLTSNDEYANLPFNSMTLQLFGDKGTMFKSLGVKYVKEVVAVATEKHWSALTTNDKIKQNLKLNLKDMGLADTLIKMLNIGDKI